LLDRRHVRFVERGQRGGGVLAFEKSLGNTPTDYRHRLAGFRARTGRWRRGRPRGQGRDGIFFGHRPLRPGGGDLRRIELVIRGNLPGGGGEFTFGRGRTVGD